MHTKRDDKTQATIAKLVKMRAAFFLGFLCGDFLCGDILGFLNGDCLRFCVVTFRGCCVAVWRLSWILCDVLLSFLDLEAFVW